MLWFCSTRRFATEMLPFTVEPASSCVYSKLFQGRWSEPLFLFIFGLSFLNVSGRNDLKLFFCSLLSHWGSEDISRCRRRGGVNHSFPKCYRTTIFHWSVTTTTTAATNLPLLPLHRTWKVDAFALFVAYSLGNHFEEVGACCVQLGDCMFLFFF